MRLKSLMFSICCLALLTVSAAETGERDFEATVIMARQQCLLRRGEAKEKPLKLGNVLYAGDRVRTGFAGGMKLLLSSGTEFAMLPNSEMTMKKISKSDDENTVINLIKGTLQGAVHKMHGGGRIVIETINGITGIKGTEYQIEATDKYTELKVLSGEVLLTSPQGDSVIVGSGQKATSYRDRIGKLKRMNQAEAVALRSSFLVKVRDAKKNYLDRVRKAQEKK